MSRPELSYLHDGPCEPDVNMARDAVLFAAVQQGRLPGAVRVYQWRAPAVSLGRHQKVDTAVRRQYCSARGIAIVRRPSGGRGVLHGWDLTLAVALPISLLPAQARSVCGSHRLIVGAVGVALERCGFQCSAGGEAAPRTPTGGDCFSRATRADLVYSDGLKAAGGAQARSGHFLLEQVSIPLRRPAVQPSDVFHGETGARDGRLEGVPLNVLERALVSGLEETLCVRLARCRWPDDLAQEAAALAPGFRVDREPAL